MIPVPTSDRKVKIYLSLMIHFSDFNVLVSHLEFMHKLFFFFLRVDAFFYVQYIFNTLFKN